MTSLPSLQQASAGSTNTTRGADYKYDFIFYSSVIQIPTKEAYNNYCTIGPNPVLESTVLCTEAGKGIMVISTVNPTFAAST